MSRDYKQECKFLEGCLESLGIQRDKDILKIESLEKENAALRAANESVAVCSDHVLDIKGTGCLVCENAALREKVAKLTAAIDYVTEETGYYTQPSEDAK